MTTPTVHATMTEVMFRAGALLLVLATCDGFPARSEALACETTEQCEDGRVCDRGYCVVASSSDDGGLDDAGIDATIDAPPRVCDASMLPCAGTVTVKVCANAAGRTCWASCSQPVTHGQAKNRCSMLGPAGKVGPFITAEDDACFELVRIPGQRMWTALEQPLDQDLTSQGWTWNGVTLATNIRWATGEPNDSDGDENDQENCAYINESTIDNRVADKPCSEPYRFACSF